MRQLNIMRLEPLIMTPPHIGPPHNGVIMTQFFRFLNFAYADEIENETISSQIVSERACGRSWVPPLVVQLRRAAPACACGKSGVQPPQRRAWRASARKAERAAHGSARPLHSQLKSRARGDSMYIPAQSIVHCSLNRSLKAGNAPQPCDLCVT